MIHIPRGEKVQQTTVVIKINVFLLQQMIEIAADYDLGLDLRTAAYINAVHKIFNTYKEAGMTFAWDTF